ncbi:hypothetical protein K3495_g6628 [Podosphaera aphanis]|nr:hypothetical protein K3495_g6628 [Podosphaera aphanis]
MNFNSLLRLALFTLIPISLVSTTYLYLYPIFQCCGFSYPSKNSHNKSLSQAPLYQLLSSIRSAPDVAPFRLLALGDPQIEGDSSIENKEATSFPSLKRLWENVRQDNRGLLPKVRFSLHDLIDFYLDDIPNALNVLRKRVDHIGNDYYLGHIYRTLYWWTNPTHVTVLGDLIGSQWVKDDEFERRGWRYWNRVFKGGIKVEEELTSPESQESPYTQILGDDADFWKRRIINVAGNHDIGYAGDMSPARIARFTKVFGSTNYELRFQMPLRLPEQVHDEPRPNPELRIIVLNDLNLDAPASSKVLQDETYKFLNSVISISHNVERLAHFTLLLTHVPLFKEAGICTDGPYFDYFDGEFENGVKEQHHLSSDASKGLLEGIFGMSGRFDAPGQGYGRDGVILNGHDHEGCDTLHYINQSTPDELKWKTMSWDHALSSNILAQPKIPSLREVTVRSMMGAYDGNAGFLSLWFDEEDWKWRFEFTNCQIGTQHIWWVTHILDLVTLIAAIIYGGDVLFKKAYKSLSKRVSSGQNFGSIFQQKNIKQCI